VEAGRVLRQTWLLAVARCVVVDTYIIPVSVLNRRRAVPVVQIWHAVGAIKKFGWASVDTDEGAPAHVARSMRMHRGYTHVVAGGADAVAAFAQGFGIAQGNVSVTGQPRHDALVDPQVWANARRTVVEEYPTIDVTRPIVLYAPTWRRGKAVPCDDLTRSLANAQVVVSPHPLDDLTAIPAGAIDGRRVSSAHWLSVATHVVTDYSAIAFESTARQVAVWFYTYDIDTYRASPGVFIDPPVDYAAISATTATEVAALIESHENSTEGAAAAAWERLRTGHCAVSDGRATLRLMSLLGLGDDQAPAKE